MNERVSWNVIAVFCLLIFGITLATMLHPSKSFSERENRSLAQKPKLTLKTLLDGSFESEYESYLTDQFVGRDSWISLKTAAQKATLRQEDNDVYFAADDYLIEKHTGTFTGSNAKRNADLLSEFARKMTETYGAEHFTVMIAPNAVDILAEKLPALAAPYDEHAYLEQIRANLPEGTWLDLEQVLSAHKDEYIYYRTDHHWTTLGAWYAWQAFAEKTGLASPVMTEYDMQTVTDSFEGTVAAKVGGKVHADEISTMPRKDAASYQLTYNQSDDVRNSLYQESALDSRDKYAYFYGGNTALIQGKSTADSERRLLVIKDSYANSFAPFLYDSFARVDMVDIRYYNEPLSKLLTDGNYTDVLFLYNAAGFAEDASLAKLLV